MKGKGIVIVGAQFGDEGKGKIVDTLSENADIVVRYQGGGNAGHTIVVNGQTFKLHLVPSGVVRGKRSLVGAGCVVDPVALAQEITQLSKGGIQVTPALLGIDFRAQVILPWHKAIEMATGSKSKIGTTGKGIGPAYEDACSRMGLHFWEFADAARLEQRLGEIAPFKQRGINAALAANEFSEIQIPQEQTSLMLVLDQYTALSTQLALFACDVSSEVNTALENGETVLFEGAQGTHLDKHFGTYPFVTSSHPIAGGACIGAGVGPRAITEVHGVAKAYTTRVGEGPFPTELTDDLGELITQKGNEFGTTTGRKRRVGWLDACLLRKSQELNGFTSIHVTKLDVLSSIDPLLIAVAYEMPDGKLLSTLPAQTNLVQKAVPQYIKLTGFPTLSKEEWKKIAKEGREKGFAALPSSVRTYLATIEELIGVPIASASVGPERDDIIWEDVSKE